MTCVGWLALCVFSDAWRRTQGLGEGPMRTWGVRGAWWEKGLLGPSRAFSGLLGLVRAF